MWPWLAIAGLDAFHGANPAMGWLFAVALGLHRNSRVSVALALLPIAAGHAAAIAIVAVAFALAGVLIDTSLVVRASGVLLIGWALYHALYGHRRRVRFGMQVGMWGLAAWSFLMATAHGAGFMLIPALAPLCLAPSTSSLPDMPGSLAIALASVGLHTTAMLAVTAAIAFLVYDWVGLEVLRRGWINVDLLWTGALAICGGLLLFWPHA